MHDILMSSGVLVFRPSAFTQELSHFPLILGLELLALWNFHFLKEHPGEKLLPFPTIHSGRHLVATILI